METIGVRHPRGGAATPAVPVPCGPVDGDRGPLPADDTISVHERDDGHWNVITIAGDIDLVTAPTLAAVLAWALAPPGHSHPLGPDRSSSST